MPSGVALDGENSRLRSWREAVQFALLTFGWTWGLHGTLVATRRRYSREPGLSMALYGLGLAGPSAAAFVDGFVTLDHK